MEDMVAEVTMEDISSVKKKLSFEIPWEDVKRELDSIYKTLGKNAKIKGFRQGKVPRNVLETHYKEQAEQEVISDIISKHYTDAVEERKLVPVEQPTIDQKGIKKGENFFFTTTFETQPVVDLKDYIGIELEKEEVEITEADIAERLEQIRQMYATLEDIEEDRALVNGDFAVIDFEGKLDGEARKELVSEDYVFQAGSQSFVPGFEEQIAGMKKGEKRDITVTFPENYSAKDIAGKEVEFSITLKNIREKILPELNEDFVKNFERFETLEDLRESVRKSLEEEENGRIKTELQSAIVDKLLEKNEFEVPSSWVEEQLYNMMLSARQRMVRNGMPDEEAAKLSYSLREKFNDQAVKIAKASFMFHEIAKKESLKVDEQDVDNRMKALALRYGQDYDSIKRIYEENNAQERLRDELIEQKAADFVEERAVITLVKKDRKKEE